MQRNGFAIAAGLAVAALLGSASSSGGRKPPSTTPQKIPPGGGTPVSKPTPSTSPLGDLTTVFPTAPPFGNAPGQTPIEHDPNTAASVQPVPGDPSGTVRRVVDPLTQYETPVDASGSPTGFPAPHGVPATALSGFTSAPSSSSDSTDVSAPWTEVGRVAGVADLSRIFG